MLTRVVLVDDVADVRRLVRTALRFRGGFEVVAEAGDGASAVAAAGSLQPDIVVLDIGLPDLAGRDVLSGIRRAAPRAKVVVFSGTETVDRAWIRARADGYVLKDADLDFLVDLLETLGRSPGDVATLALDHDLRGIAAARSFVRDTCRDWGLQRVADDLLVVVSELVTNALVHAQSPCQLRLSCAGSSVRVEVLDDGTGTPDPQPAGTTAEHGRGLHLVSALAAAWGIEAIPQDGKLVWAELELTG